MQIGNAQEWQWMGVIDSVISGETNDHPHAFLWIPSNCKQVRGVVIGQHNMIEEGILENAKFRKTLSQLGFAEVWITPGYEATFDFNNNAGKYFNELMRSLANISGYTELVNAPIIPIGHSAYASYPWNFAAWDPGRTLAIISVHGDAPLTNLTGNGKPHPDWGNRTIEGVPALFVMGEYEWWEKRIEPAFDYVNKHPKAPISLFADAGHGHFDYSDELVDYLAMFISKAAKYRLPEKSEINKPVVLKPINPADGWLMDRWHKDSLPKAIAASYSSYKGDKKFASWIFDKEMADATEKYYAKARGKQNQYIGFKQNGEILVPVSQHAQYNLKFIPLNDGISFTLKAFFSDTSKVKPVADFAKTPLLIDRICGPVKKINDTTFRLSFYRMGFNNGKRSSDIWLLAHNKGDEKFKSAVQQLDMHFPIINNQGAEQHIRFVSIPDQNNKTKSLVLNASSDAQLTVQYYVKEGPAIIENNKLVFTQIPPRSKYPIKVTVVAWQYGKSTEPKVQTAKPVEQSFFINK